MKKHKEYDCLASKIKIHYLPEVNKDESVFGLYSNVSNEIHVQTHMRGKKMPDDVIGHTMCHEIVHSWFWHSGYHDLYANEQLVDLIGGMLWQYLKTRK